jgi:cytoskeletal protein CcmA (bactofilin family)
MFEVKRKPNTAGSLRSSAPAAARAFDVPGAAALTSEPSIVAAAPIQPPSARPRTLPPVIEKPTRDAKDYQTKLPVIIGEAAYKGTLRLDGIGSGQLGGSGGSLNLRQRTRPFLHEPEFSGEVSFRDMIRVNGHIAGTVYSKKGTLIIDISATVDANIDVAVAVISGTVNGDIIARERVEIGPKGRIYGNIWTRSIEIKNGAIFEGLCTMMAEEQVC